jgi:glutathione peroxidase-family protein
MHKIFGSHDVAILRQEIISQCTWSDTYSSLKHILKRTANQLPLLISFPSRNDEQESTNSNTQTIFFFDRNLSNKLLLTPLQQRVDQPELFDIYPNHCTFAITDAFKGNSRR